MLPSENADRDFAFSVLPMICSFPELLVKLGVNLRSFAFGLAGQRE